MHFNSKQLFITEKQYRLKCECYQATPFTSYIHCTRDIILKLKTLNYTCPLRMEVNFNFCLSNTSLTLLSMTECRSSEIVTHAFHKCLCHNKNNLGQTIVIRR